MTKHKSYWLNLFKFIFLRKLNLYALTLVLNILFKLYFKINFI